MQLIILALFILLRITPAGRCRHATGKEACDASYPVTRKAHEGLRPACSALSCIDKNAFSFLSPAKGQTAQKTPLTM